jgi:hypothetical protein
MVEGQRFVKVRTGADTVAAIYPEFSNGFTVKAERRK